MPSHIYTRIGAWDKSIRANLRSVEAAHRFEAAEHAGALWDQDAHALDYLVYAYLQLGRVDEARAEVEALARDTLFRRLVSRLGQDRIDAAAAAIARRETDPYSAVEELLS
jgi:hypothetical protein